MEKDHDITEYPGFRPIKLSDKDLFDRVFSEFQPEISECTFTNLYAWREAYSLEVSIADGMVLVRSGSYKNPRFFYPFGKGDVKDMMLKIMETCGGSFMRVPGRIASLFSGHNNIISREDRDNADYVYKISDLLELKGKKYDGKRNLIKKFRKEYEYEYVSLKGENTRECLDFEKEWCEVKGCDSVESLSMERLALMEMAGNFDHFGLIGGAIKVEGRICAIAIAEKLNDSTLVMHILKADPAKRGLYQTILHDFLISRAGSLEYVNLEQDLGVEGLRAAKLSYHPERIALKYEILKAL